MASGTGNDNVAVTLDTARRRSRCRSSAATPRSPRRSGTDAETVAPVLGNDVPADIAGRDDRRHRHDGHLHAADRHRQRGSEPGRDLRPGLGLQVRRRHHHGHLHRADANGNVSAPKTFKVVVRRDVPVNGTVGGTVPATLSLTLGAAGAVRRLHPGRQADLPGLHRGQRHLDRRRRAAERLRPEPVGTGHLVNGTFVLPQPLQARARNAANTGTAFNNIGSSR